MNFSSRNFQSPACVLKSDLKLPHVGGDNEFIHNVLLTLLLRLNLQPKEPGRVVDCAEVPRFLYRN